MIKENEIELYSLDVFETEIPSLSQLEDFMGKLRGLVAAYVDQEYRITHLLFRTPKERNEAHEVAEKHGIKTAIRVETAIVDRRWIPALKETQ